MMHSDSV